MKTKVYSAKSMMISVLSREFMSISFHSAGAFASRSTGIERKVPLIFFHFLPLKDYFSAFTCLISFPTNIIGMKQPVSLETIRSLYFCIVFFIGEIGRDYRWPAKG